MWWRGWGAEIYNSAAQLRRRSCKSQPPTPATTYMILRLEDMQGDVGLRGTLLRPEAKLALLSSCAEGERGGRGGCRGRGKEEEKEFIVTPRRRSSLVRMVHTSEVQTTPGEKGPAQPVSKEEEEGNWDLCLHAIMMQKYWRGCSSQYLQVAMCRWMTGSGRRGARQM